LIPWKADRSSKANELLNRRGENEDRYRNHEGYPEPLSEIGDTVAEMSGHPSFFSRRVSRVGMGCMFSGIMCCNVLFMASMISVIHVRPSYPRSHY